MQFRKHIYRFSFVFLSLIFLLILFSVKLVLIQVFRSDHLAALAEKQHNYFVEIEPVRGSIFDRNLRPLAFNVTVHSLYANPRAMTPADKEKAVRDLPGLLQISPSELQERLSKDKFFVWLARKLPRGVKEQVEALKLSGLGFRKESKRFYPNGSLAAHIIGFAGVDNQGLEGLELHYNDKLQGKPGQTYILRDARQRELLIEEDFLAPRDGMHLVLTIDETIQYLAERALAAAVEKYKAVAGTVIVIDVRTGQVLAIANHPTYNLDRVQESTLESRTNRAIGYVYEPGSVLKVVTAAAALEEDAFKESDVLFCENGEYRVANHTLTDHRPHGNLSFADVIKVSSNIGTVKVAQKLGAENIYKYGTRFRLGHLTGIDLKGEVPGGLKHPSKWSKTTIGAIPIGYEVTVTPLQLVSIIAAVANDGVYMRPYVVQYIKNNQEQVIKSFGPKVLDRVISAGTAHRLRDILVGVVAEGTGKQAQIEGVAVAGKTGTARKVVAGAYAPGKYYASFVGFAPADDPKLAAVVVIDEPRGSYFGGTVGAPVFREVIENSLKYLQMAGN